MFGPTNVLPLAKNVLSSAKDRVDGLEGKSPNIFSNVPYSFARKQSQGSKIKSALTPKSVGEILSGR
jgi:hypothetical protein